MDEQTDRWMDERMIGWITQSCLPNVVQNIGVEKKREDGEKTKRACRWEKR